MKNVHSAIKKCLFFDNFANIEIQTYPKSAQSLPKGCPKVAQRLNFNALFCLLQPQISKVFSRLLEQFFLTIGQNNFDNKILFQKLQTMYLKLAEFPLCGVAVNHVLLNLMTL